MRKIYFGTGNKHKFQEFKESITENFQLIQKEKEILEPQIDSVEEVSRHKLKRFLKKSKLEDEWVFVEDSGLFIEGLNGFPGAFTSAFSSKVERNKILRLIDENNKAEFRTSVAIKNPKTGRIETLIGRCKGKLVEPRGEEGWGFDPYFQPKGHNKTFSEDLDHKEKVSHRKKAVSKLSDYLNQNF